MVPSVNAINLQCIVKNPKWLFLMKNPLFKLIFFCALLSGNFAEAQSRPDETEYNLLSKKLVNTFVFPVSVTGSCRSSVVSMKVTFQNRMLRNIAYSPNFPDALMEQVRSNVNLFMEIKWDKIFPGLKDKTGFSIIIPVIYYFEAGCTEQMTSLEFSKTVGQGITFGNTDDSESRIVRPVLIKLTGSK